jgi:hypothetical protein
MPDVQQLADNTPSAMITLTSDDADTGPSPVTISLTRRPPISRPGVRLAER